MEKFEKNHAFHCFAGAIDIFIEFYKNVTSAFINIGFVSLKKILEVGIIEVFWLPRELLVGLSNDRQFFGVILAKT